MESAIHFKMTKHLALGLATLLVVAGIVFGLAGNSMAGGILVGTGILLASFAAFRSGHLTIW